MQIETIYEDKDCLVINKPAGMVVHADENGRNFEESVVEAVLSKLNFPEPGLRPGIVHRLDKDTSGILLIAKHGKALEFFKQQFKDRRVEKIYLALVKGKLAHKEAVIDSPITRSKLNRKKMAVSSEKSGRNAITEYKVVREFEPAKGKFASLLEIKLKTGRTHQIRVHMNAIRHPVVGDTVYGDRNFNKFFKDKFGLNRQFLHAEKLGFNSFAGNKKLHFTVELSNQLKKILNSL